MTRMVADVPVGMFLSSGIDSALVTAIAQKNSSNPVKTFTIGFNDKERNEADRAKEQPFSEIVMSGLHFVPEDNV